ILFSGVRSVPEFRERFALLSSRRDQLAVAFALGFLIQATTIYVFQGGLRQLTTRTSMDLVVAAAILAPFLEEPWMRGYLYTSFRSRYSVGTSIVFVSVITLLFHGTQSVSSIHSFVGLTLLAVVTCLLRERTKSLWPPIVCHLAFNAIPAATI